MARGMRSGGGVSFLFIIFIILIILTIPFGMIMYQSIDNQTQMRRMNQTPVVNGTYNGVSTILGTGLSVQQVVILMLLLVIGLLAALYFIGV